MERLDLQCLYALRSKWRSGSEGVLNVLEFCMGLGVIANEYVCPKCDKSMRLTERKAVSDGYEWVCRTKKSPSHYVKRSVRSGPWFSESWLTIVVND
jgi:hypothetical protein